MRGLEMNYTFAMAIGKDAANRQMRKAGRTKWSVADYNLACRTVEKLRKQFGFDPCWNRNVSH